jgi:hypothetical protein
MNLLLMLLPLLSKFSVGRSANSGDGRVGKAIQWDEETIAGDIKRRYLRNVVPNQR